MITISARFVIGKAAWTFPKKEFGSEKNDSLPGADMYVNEPMMNQDASISTTLMKIPKVDLRVTRQDGSQGALLVGHLQIEALATLRPGLRVQPLGP